MPPMQRPAEETDERRRVLHQCQRRARGGAANPHAACKLPWDRIPPGLVGCIAVDRLLVAARDVPWARPLLQLQPAYRPARRSPGPPKSEIPAVSVNVSHPQLQELVQMGLLVPTSEHRGKHALCGLFGVPKGPDKARVRLRRAAGQRGTSTAPRPAAPVHAHGASRGRPPLPVRGNRRLPSFLLPIPDPGRSRAILHD